MDHRVESPRGHRSFQLEPGEVGRVRRRCYIAAPPACPVWRLYSPLVRVVAPMKSWRSSARAGYRPRRFRNHGHLNSGRVEVGNRHYQSSRHAIGHRSSPRFQRAKASLLPGIRGPHVDSADWSWSPDGTELAGTAATPPTYRGALVIYSLATGRFTRLYESQTAVSPIFLNDGRRLLFQEGSKMMLIDRVTHATRELMSVAPDAMACAGRSRATTGQSISPVRSSRRTSG